MGPNIIFSNTKKSVVCGLNCLICKLNLHSLRDQFSIRCKENISLESNPET